MAATDTDDTLLAYTLAGTDAASFDINGSTGQLRTKAGVTYDFEAKSSYQRHRAGPGQQGRKWRNRHDDGRHYRP